MDDYEKLAVDFIQLPPRALPEDWIAVTVSDVADMLAPKLAFGNPGAPLSSAAIRLLSASTTLLATDPWTVLEKRPPRSA